MNNITYFYIIFSCFFILYIYFKSFNLIKHTDNNNNLYYTRKTHKSKALSILILLKKFIIKLSNILNKNNPNNKYLINNLKKNIIIKELPKKYTKHISYLYNNNTIYICLRNTTNIFEKNINDLYFIIMHELAHIITKNKGHGKEYWNNNKLIINTAIKYKLYKYKNYNKNPTYICNKIINSTPI